MKDILFRHSQAVLSDAVVKVAAISIRNEKIEKIRHVAKETDLTRQIDFDGLSIFSGFIDVHIHGAIGIDVNAADTDGLFKIAEFLARNGVTAWVPTLVPDSDENYRRAIVAIDKLMEIQVDQPVAQALGVHYEGVFANEKMCGALRPEFFKTFSNNRADLTATEENHPVAPTTPSSPTTPAFGHPSSDRRGALKPPLLSQGEELIGLPRLKKGVHMTTLAPEIEGGIELIKELVRQGWICSIGHTKADIDILDQALAAGVQHLTHFYNAMTGLHHRNLGVVGWALTNEAVTFDIIADGVHVCSRASEDARICLPRQITRQSFAHQRFRGADRFGRW